MNMFIKAVIFILAIAVVAGLGFAGWWVKREVNAYFFYDGATQEMICEMVKPEALKDPSICAK